MTSDFARLPNMISNGNHVNIPITKSQGKSFKFQELHSRFPGFGHKDTQELLFKWGMKENCYIKKYTFDQHFQPYLIDNFLDDFFNQAKPRIKSVKDDWKFLERIEKVDSFETLHSITSMDFFKRLKKVCRKGEIKKCFDEYHDNFLVSDMLRKTLLVDDCEEYALFSTEERKEFIFHLFKSLCLGGKLCQYEDFLDVYLDTTKKIYKDLISVGKDQNGELRVTCLVYKIMNLELFPLDHVQNFCYVCIDPTKRTVNLFYHASEAYY